MDDGASELDVVINYGRFLDGDCRPLVDELSMIATAAADNDVLVKAILEACYYTPNQLREACALCMWNGADMLKTSTGFGRGGAMVQDVELMLKFGPVKASGGVRTYADACRFLDLGCTRIGSSQLVFPE